MRLSKKAIVVAALVALVLVGILAGITLASDDATSSGKTLLARVAAILGIDQAKVEDAFKQAQKEMQSEALDNFLKNMVAQGRLTQEQADQYKAWQNARPNLPAEFGFGGPMGRGRGGFQGKGGFGHWQVPAPATTQ
ncbi:MAG: hypothetical protein Q8O43_07630 [Dehalococcoidia bacterium]|nr:hypothetical protein [Dehalococcoidia bacterium]